MLVLGRLVGQTVTIGDNIEVTVVGVQGSQIRLGISAPPEVAVHRKEVYLRIAAQTDKSPKGESVPDR